MNTQSFPRGICTIALLLFGCSAQPISPTPTATATATDQQFLTPTITESPALTPTNMPSVLCDQGDTILFTATNLTDGSGGIFQVCDGQANPVLVMPDTLEAPITFFDVLADGTLLYEISNYDNDRYFVVVQAVGESAPERIETLDGLNVGFLKWVLNGSHLLFIAVTDSENPSQALIAFDVETQAMFTLYEEYTLYHLNVAPDGESVLFTASTGMPNVKVPVMVGTLSCDNECQLIDLHSVDNIESNPAWALNGKAVVSVYYEEVVGEPPHLRITDLNGQIIEDIDLTQFAPELDNIQRILWTPDAYILVTDDSHGEYICSFDGTNFELLAILKGYDISDLVFVPE